MSNTDFYVYVHRKATNKEIFYVGKGKNNRYKVKCGRSKSWEDVVKKHGLICEIVVECIDEDLALLIECELVDLLLSSGVNLSNITKGGNGSLSNPSEETRKKQRKAKLGKKQGLKHAQKSRTAKVGKKQPRSAVDYVIGLKKKKVINSNGDIYPSATEAAKTLKLSQGNVSMCARGERREAGGLAWSYDITSTPKLEKRTLKCSNGMRFESVVDASKWVKKWRGKSASSNITNAISSKGIAYGFSWEYQLHEI